MTARFALFAVALAGCTGDYVSLGANAASAGATSRGVSSTGGATSVGGASSGGRTELGGASAGGVSAAGANATDGGPFDGGPSLPSNAGSGLPWPSGTNARNLARLAVWEQFRGRPNDVALVITNYESWDGITKPDALLDEFAPFVGKLVIAQPFWPNGSGTLAECSRGDYDAHWTDFGTTLTAHGRQASIIRLGWQFNGNDVEWAATDLETWVGCYRRIADSIRAAAPEALMDWTLGAHGTDSVPTGDAFDVYPGDYWVDIIGIDAFDMAPSSLDETSFIEQCNGPFGACTVSFQARMRGKSFGVGQWCVVTCGVVTDRGNDNPFYVDRMHQLFLDNIGILAYETYYSDIHVDTPSEFCTSLVDPPHAAAAARRYQELWAP